MHQRETERAILKRKLDAGVNIHMPAPRRIGKTWLLGRLADDLRADGWVAVEVDVQGMGTPEEFARELCVRIEAQINIRDRFKTHALQRLGNLLDGKWESPLEALGRIDPIEFAESLIAALDGTGKRSAILIDEIAYFFLKLAEADAAAANRFAYKLRALQQRYTNVRWLVTGSIGLDVIARRYGLEGAFIDFNRFELEPFTPAEARSFLRDPGLRQLLTHPFDADDPDFDALFDEIGWLAPYYLRLVANEVRPSVPGRDGGAARATRPDFEAALEKLLRPNRKSDFAVWREHVDKNLPTMDRALAFHLLAVLCRHPDGEREDTLHAGATRTQATVTRRQTRDILEILYNDGLITKRGDRYAFRSGLVRLYWLAYEVEG